MKKLHSFFKVASKDVKTLSFGLKLPENFNYLDLPGSSGTYVNNSAKLYKQMVDSFLLEVNIDDRYVGNPAELKLTNQDLLTWEDHWIDANSGRIIDPKIERINLQKNKLVHANFNLTRNALKYINLEGNKSMRGVFICDAPRLEVLNISNCQALDIINLGNNRSIKALIAKNCNLSSALQERLLRDFRPTYAASSNASFSMFRKTYETVLDLRGSEIDWGNRRVASKIRMLLCNNWLVLWDNPPPVSIIPPQMYAFFTTNLEESLIKEYYG
jgi:hypothetical protein